MAEPGVKLTDQERETLAVALHGMTCHLATGESCGVADEYDRADAVVVGATVEGMIAARLAPVEALADDLRGVTGARHIAIALDRILAEEVWCYPCARGDHAECSEIAWQPDIPCACRHATSQPEGSDS